MSVIKVTNQSLFLGIDSTIWWKRINSQPSACDSFSVTPNLSKSDAPCVIKDLIVSEDESFLAVLTSTKLVLVYSMVNFTLHSQHRLPRAASKINFSKDGQLLLVADKTGDALIYDTNNTQDEGCKVLGHLSILTDIIMTPDNKYVITCDRDEKIRVTNYPGTFNIKSFCLGHKEFITSIHLLPHNDKYLLSTSGDGTVKVWEYLKGKEVYSMDINKYIEDKNSILDFQKIMKEEDIEAVSLPINHSSCCKKGETSSLFAVSLHTQTTVLVFEISTVTESFSFILLDKVSTEEYLHGLSITPDSLWLALTGDSVKLQQWTLTNNKYVLFNSENIEYKNDKKEIDVIDKNEITLLYKRKFDNLQEYHKRKKQRLGTD